MGTVISFRIPTEANSNQQVRGAGEAVSRGQDNGSEPPACSLKHAHSSTRLSSTGRYAPAVIQAACRDSMRHYPANPFPTVLSGVVSCRLLNRCIVGEYQVEHRLNERRLRTEQQNRECKLERKK